MAKENYRKKDVEAVELDLYVVTPAYWTMFCDQCARRELCWESSGDVPRVNKDCLPRIAPPTNWQKAKK
jgi:hypothetical protein